jgi:hypothetical protein
MDYERQHMNGAFFQMKKMNARSDVGLVCVVVVVVVINTITTLVIVS